MTPKHDDLNVIESGTCGPLVHLTGSDVNMTLFKPCPVVWNLNCSGDGYFGLFLHILNFLSRREFKVDGKYLVVC